MDERGRAAHCSLLTAHCTAKPGFTLIEALVTAFIIGMMVIFLSSMVSLLGLTRQTRQKDVALRVIHQKVESLRAAGYDDLGASGSFSDDLLASLPNGAASTTITDFNADIKKVVVSVAWQEAGDPLRYLSITTLVAKDSSL